MTTTLDEPPTYSRASLLPLIDETTRRLLDDIDRAAEVLTLADFVLYDRIMDELDINIEKDETLIRVLYDLLKTDKEIFERMDNYTNTYLKYEEYHGDSPDMIEIYRYLRNMFNTAFKRYEREDQARHREILIGGRKQKRKYRSKKRKSNKRKRKYRSKKRKYRKL